MVIRPLFLAFVVGAALYAAPASACPVLVKASPRVGSSVEGPVDHVTLHFSGPVDAAHSTLEVKDGKGRSVVTGNLAGAGDPVDTLSVPVKTISGKYKVFWHVHCTCEDGESSVYPGKFTFTVQ